MLADLLERCADAWDVVAVILIRVLRQVLRDVGVRQKQPDNVAVASFFGVIFQLS